MLAALILAASPITVVARLDDNEELLRFRAAMCEAWQGKRAVKLWGDRSSDAGTVSWEVELSPEPSGRVLARVTERRSSPPPTGITVSGDRPAHGEGPPLVYDALELVTSDGKRAAGDTVDCKAVAEGRLIPQLKSRGTGQTLKW